MSRFAAALFSALFAWAAWLQLNDPDPILWCATYLIAALFAAAAAAGRPLPAAASAAFALVTAAWAFWLATIVFGDGETQRMFPGEKGTGLAFVDSEEGREMGGLAIVAVAMTAVSWFARRRDVQSERTQDG